MSETPPPSPVITPAAAPAVKPAVVVSPEQAAINVKTKEAMRKSVKALASSGLEGKALGTAAGKLSSIAYNAPSLTQKALKDLFTQIGVEGLDSVKAGLSAARKKEPNLSERAV